MSPPVEPAGGEVGPSVAVPLPLLVQLQASLPVALLLSMID
jgi:hypothetical protein